MKNICSKKNFSDFEIAELIRAGKQFNEKSLFFPFLLFLCLIFSSCGTTSFLRKEKYTNPPVLPIETLAPPEIVWTPFFESDAEQNDGKTAVFYTQHTIKEENIKWTCIKIDLNENWEIAAEPLPENLGKSFYLQEFSDKYKTVAAANTVPFSSGESGIFPVSVVKINGEMVCPANPDYCALGLKKIANVAKNSDNPSDSTSDNFENDFVWRAKIFSSQNEQDLADYDYAFGGFFVILDGDNIFEFKKQKRSRTAAGLSDNGRFLFLFAACGIHEPAGKNGLNFEECALILQKMGCTNAMEFDGGHSSGLTLCNENLIKPLLQRKISAAFGFKSKKIKEGEVTP